MSHSNPKFLTDTIIEGKYRIGELLGKGGMGSVYTATHLRLKNQVAIKLLNAEVKEHQVAVNRFHREAKAAASIGHGNICEVIDFGETDDGYPFFVMPRLQGRTLRDILDDHLEKGVIPPPSRISDIVLQTLSALQAAHNKGIVHRDLKPENIFITRMGDREDFVKLLDFGISKIIGSTSSAGLTQTGVQVGTPGYMSPEQINESRTVDSRTDIWAVGVILYEALTGTRPFEADSYPGIVKRICFEELVPPRQLNRAVPESFVPVITKALAKKTTNRYQSTNEMRAALDLAEKGAHSQSQTPISSPEVYARTLVSTPPEPAVESKSVARESAILDPPVDITEDATIRHKQNLETRQAIAAAQPPSPPEKNVPIVNSLPSAGQPRVTPGTHTKTLWLIGAVIGSLLLIAVVIGTATQHSHDRHPTEVAVSPQTIRIHVAGLPQDATIFVGHKQMTSNPFVLPLSKQAVSMRVNAPDHEQGIWTIVPDKDMTIKAHLTPQKKEVLPSLTTPKVVPKTDGTVQENENPQTSQKKDAPLRPKKKNATNRPKTVDPKPDVENKKRLVNVGLGIKAAPSLED